MPNARDVEDWLNMENELPTSPQMSDEEILAIAVGDSTESESVWPCAFNAAKTNDGLRNAIKL